MKIGITGSSGFIGSHLVRHFAKEGHTVQAYGRSTPPKQLLNYAQFIKWDLTKSNCKEFDGDIFIHCASFVDLWGDYKKMHQITVEGTKKSLNIAKKAKHYIYISSGSVYGANNHKFLIKEDTPYPIKHSNNYAKTKMEAELQIKDKLNTFRQITILRPHFVYGPGDRTLIPRLMESFRFGKAYVVGNGKNKISPTHVGNICQGLSLIIKSRQEGLKIYNITDNDTICLNDVYLKLINLFDLKIQVQHIPYLLAYSLAMALESKSKFIPTYKPLITKDVANQFTNTSILSIENLSKDLGYKPKLNINEGFKDLANWVESIGGLSVYLKRYRSLTWDGKLFSY